MNDQYATRYSTKPGMRWGMAIRPEILLIVLTIAAVAIAITRAIFQPSGIAWLIAMKEITPGTVGEIAKVLAPLSALSLAIERMLETIFDLFEQAVDEVAKLGSAGLQGLQWFQAELDRAWDAARSAASNLDGTPEKLNILQEAEARIIAANQRIAGLSKDPRYVSNKRVLTIWLGLMMGLVFAVLTDTGIFQLLQISVPRIVDMLVTGFILGAGSGPVHSLVGMLQGAKDAISSISSLGGIRAQLKDLQEKVNP